MVKMNITPDAKELNKVTHKLSATAKGLVLPPHAAIHKMTDKVPQVPQDSTIEDVRNFLFKDIKRFHTINYIYITNKNNKLVGVLTIKDIFRHNPVARVKQVMEKQLIYAHPQTDREKIVRLSIENHLKAIPILDMDKTFLGVFSSDQILTTLKQEADEDILHMAGIIPSRRTHQNLHTDLSVFRSFSLRIPWIIVGLLGGLLAAQIMGLFEQTLQKNLILATFIPLVVYIANAVGIQDQTLYIRDIAGRPAVSLLHFYLKQIATSALIAISSCTAIFLLTLFVWQQPYIGIVIATAVLIAILTATTLALLIPFILGKLKFDPAIGSGPFTTIIQDILSITIYFTVATLLL